MQQQTLRQQMRQARRALPANLWAQKSNAIRMQVLQHQQYRDAARIFTYYSIQNEADTRALVAQAWADGKTVAVPVCGAGGQMDFVAITPSTPLRQTKQGTHEPALDPAAILHPTADDLFLVPGLAFDAAGNRCGYGGGFYDRYLAAHPAAVPTALCFGFQICPQALQPAPHDMPMAWLVTESGWHKCPRTLTKP